MQTNYFRNYDYYYIIMNLIHGVLIIRKKITYLSAFNYFFHKSFILKGLQESIMING